MQATERTKERQRVPDPNEYLIQLLASAQRMHWSESETRRRAGVSRWRLQSAHCPLDRETQHMLESSP